MKNGKSSHFLQKDYSRKDKLMTLNRIISLMLRRHICSRRTSENDDIFANLLRLDNSSKGYIANIAEQLRESFPEDDEFVLRFPTSEFKLQVLDRARYILAEIEYDVTGRTGELIISSNEDVHIEHIIPQKITTKKAKDEFGDWETYLGDKARIHHKTKVHYIGNLTLLAGSLNITASNNPFSRKKKSYKESNISITNKLAAQNDFKFFHVEKRGGDLAEIAKRIWKI
ncbi:HNH endonuclease family protein [Sphingobacterium sp. MYb382]|uniref:HNH endonuclease family protein n=1 Tax=Sphingobacterium sp. MYb382 TaxID=2745278 RepID=UPI0030A49C4B